MIMIIITTKNKNVLERDITAEKQNHYSILIIISSNKKKIGIFDSLFCVSVLKNKFEEKNYKIKLLIYNVTKKNH